MGFILVLSAEFKYTFQILLIKETRKTVAWICQQQLGLSVGSRHIPKVQP